MSKRTRATIDNKDPDEAEPYAIAETEEHFLNSMTSKAKNSYGMPLRHHSANSLTASSSLLEFESNSTHKRTGLPGTVWMCDCGNLRDLSQEGKMEVNPLSQLASRRNSKTGGGVDWFVDWNAKSKNDALIANPSVHSQYYSRDSNKPQASEFVEIFNNRDSCMQGCLASCQIKGNWLKKDRNHAFARCIPKSDFTCMESIFNDRGANIEGSYAAKAVAFQIHDTSTLAVLPQQAKAKESLASAPQDSWRITFAYTDATYEDHDECDSKCRGVAKATDPNAKSYKCKFYPAALLFKDYELRKSMLEKKVDVKFWGCCTMATWPKMCNLDKGGGRYGSGSANEVYLEPWRIPADYFQKACEDNAIPDGLQFIDEDGGRDCEDESNERAKFWAIEGCRGDNHKVTWFDQTYSTR